MRIVRFTTVGIALTATLTSCIGPFTRRTPPVGPPALSAEFDSGTAQARLRWERSRQRHFSHYEVERAKDAEFAPIARISDRRDTTFVDEGLLADTSYRYRVKQLFGKDLKGVVSSDVAVGIIHPFAQTWSLPSGFLPTRMAVGTGGTVYVVGVGSNVVERYDRTGGALGGWQFSSGTVASLETGTLDGPGVALDRDGNLYVTYNLLRQGRSPHSMWSKFDSNERHVWTKDLQGLFARHIAIHGDQVYIEAISHLQQFNTDGLMLAQYPVPPLLISSLRFWRGDFAALVEPLSVSDVGWQSPRLVIYGSAARTEVETVFGRDPLSETDRGAGLLRRPSDFAVHEASNRAFVVNAGYGRIEVFKDGRYLTRWGKKDGDDMAFAFSGSATVIDNMSRGTTHEQQVVAGGIALNPQDYVLVADTFNNRIQIFHP